LLYHEVHGKNGSALILIPFELDWYFALFFIIDLMGSINESL